MSKGFHFIAAILICKILLTSVKCTKHHTNESALRRSCERECVRRATVYYRFA